MIHMPYGMYALLSAMLCSVQCFCAMLCSALFAMLCSVFALCAMLCSVFALCAMLCSVLCTMLCAVLCAGSTPPLVIFEKNGIKIVFHFGKDRPRPDVQVIAVSVTSTCQSPVKEFAFQAAVPKVIVSYDSKVLLNNNNNSNDDLYFMNAHMFRSKVPVQHAG